PPAAEISLPGWSWFPPYHNPETLAIATDAGVLGLFGFRQPGNLDPALFSLLDRELRLTDARSAPGRAQIVHAEEQGFWTLAGEKLQHWRLALDRTHGRRFDLVWSLPKIGSPLHVSQVSPERQTLFVMSQTTSPPACLATAVNAANGRILWQRALGLAC